MFVPIIPLSGMKYYKVEFCQLLLIIHEVLTSEKFDFFLDHKQSQINDPRLLLTS